MTLLSKEHYEMMETFEHEFRGEFRLDKEGKEFWAMGRIYQNGDANNAFLAFRRGVAYGQAISR